MTRPGSTQHRCGRQVPPRNMMFRCRSRSSWGLGSLGIAILYNVTNILLLRFMVDTDWRGCRACRQPDRILQDL